MATITELSPLHPNNPQLFRNLNECDKAIDRKECHPTRISPLKTTIATLQNVVLPLLQKQCPGDVEETTLANMKWDLIEGNINKPDGAIDRRYQFIAFDMLSEEPSAVQKHPSWKTPFCIHDQFDQFDHFGAFGWATSYAAARATKIINTP